MFLASDLLEGLLDILLHHGLLLLKLQPLHRQNLQLLLLQLLQLVPDIRIHEVSYILAVVDFRDGVVAPFLSDYVVLLQGDVEDPSAAVLLLDFADVGPLDFLGEVDCDRGAVDVVPAFGLGDVHTVEVVFLPADFVFFRDGLLDAHHSLASLSLRLLNPQLLQSTDLHSGQTILLNPGPNRSLLLLTEILHPLQIHLIENNQDRFVLEERFDGMIQMDLLEHRVPALLGRIHEVYHAALEVGQGSDRLHFDCVHFLELVVQDARGVDYLETQVVELGVADVQSLGGEGVGLDLDVRPADAVDEAGFADVGVAGEQNGALVGVYGGQPRHMFPHLLEVRQRRPDLADHSAHPTQSRPLQGLASVEGIGILDEFEVIATHIVDHILGRFDMAQGQFVVVLIVEDVEEVTVEGMDVLHLGEVLEDVEQFF